MIVLWAGTFCPEPHRWYSKGLHSAVNVNTAFKADWEKPGASRELDSASLFVGPSGGLGSHSQKSPSYHCSGFLSRFLNEGGAGRALLSPDRTELCILDDFPQTTTQKIP